MKILFTILALVFAIDGFCQVDTIIRQTRRDTTRPARQRTVTDTTARTQPVRIPRPDSVSGYIDTLHKDSAVAKADSLAVAPAPVVAKAIPWQEDTAFMRLISIKGSPQQKQERFDGDPRKADSKDELFYIIAGILLFMGIIKVLYPKYYQNTFRLIFQTSLRQKQTPEQIVQGYVPGFLLNVLFFMTAGVLAGLFAQQQGFLQGPLWLLILFSTAVLAVIYLVKYLVTLFVGWVFNVQQQAGMYRFVVFLVNRVAGVVLLPLVIILAFYGGDVQTVAFTVAAAICVFLLLYRYTVLLTVMRKNLKVSALHFFIYLCAVELMPLLVIYKVLLREINRQ